MSIILNLNKNFENRIRLGIMSVLVVNDWVDFNTLKEILEVTDGNLASHISSLESNKYIETKKQFVGKKPKTSYRATFYGREEFQKHIDALEDIINKQINIK
ncbi:MAG: transcriptional regulator [Bacteroidales bacterium]|nr:transcriptional regulator [Bacteroidales bacterium]MBN2757157.1 transcriptional regulator [Bacteroidales bacterium]